MGRNKDKATIGSALSDREIRQIVDEAITLAAERIKQQSMPTSIGDLVRLLEVRHEFSERDTPQEITISWRENPSPEDLRPEKPQQDGDLLDDLAA
jgi:hypothetical protein